MNKNKKVLLLIIVLAMSTILLVNKVHAAKELTCYYDKGLRYSYTMFVQFADGSQKVYIGYYAERYEDGTWSDNWFDPSENSNVNIEFRGVKEFYDAETKTVSRCPEFTKENGHKSGTRDSKETYTFYFYDEDGTSFWRPDYGLIDSKDGIPNIADYYQTFKKEDDYSEEIEKTNWTAKCVYLGPSGDKTYTLYFNDEKYIINIESSIVQVRTNFSISELKTFYEESSSCPVRLYNTSNTSIAQSTGQSYSTLYMNNTSGAAILTLDINESEYYEIPEPPQPKPPINNCEDLLGEELVSKINSVMNVIKIAVPIILIALGIMDFTKAVFSGEDEMKKAQKTFLKRIAAALIIFLSPILINLLLTVTNKVWNTINPNTCIK